METGTLPEVVTPSSELWPPADGRRTVVLSLATSEVEAALIDQLAARVALAAPGAKLEVVTDADDAVARAEGDTVIAPVGVAWSARDRGGDRSFHLRDLRVLGDPSRPRPAQQRRILGREPDRVSIIVGEPARLADLQLRWNEHTGTTGRARGLAGFVARQARLAVERSERTRVGERYKTAEDVADDLYSSASFQEAVRELAAGQERDVDEVLGEARACLGEMATVQNRFARDIWAELTSFSWSRAYRLDVDEDELERLRELGRHHALVFLPSHKSNLDSPVMSSTLRQHDFPPNHVMGGINMAFWPMGSLGRRVGVVFIRRTFGGDEVYKLALRRYLAYLASKRLNLEWYLEGGRSRSGKLLPPRMGLLDYLARGVEEMDGPEVWLVPVSITYDRLREVADMAAESRGAAKEREGVRWMVNYLRSQGDPLGEVHVRFGEPLGLRGALAGAEGEQRSIAMSKVAFEVCTRTNRATPVTPTSLVTLALLGADGWAVTLPQAVDLVRPLLDYVTARDLPGLDRVMALRSARGVRGVLRSLVEIGVVDEFGAGAEPVFRIRPERELVAAFYRNTVIHWFVNRAIFELSIVSASERPGVDPMAAVVDAGLSLRDLLKFEFFFSDKAAFPAEMEDEVRFIAPEWQSGGADLVSTVEASVAASGTLVADRVLRSFVEAYWLVADRLAAAGADEVDDKSFLAGCLEVGRQYQLQRRIVSGEAVSAELFRSALRLAANRGLCDPYAPALAERRQELADELHDVLRRLEFATRWEQRHRARREGDRGRRSAG